MSVFEICHSLLSKPLANIREGTDSFGLRCLRLVAQVLNGHLHRYPVSEGESARDDISGQWHDLT